ELGRSIVGQCGTLISRVTYVKHGTCKKFVIIDAGMNDLVRPALYQAYHEIENLSSDAEAESLSVEIAKKIQDEMVYPGQVKITVIRETRSVSFAK
ncbi:MAG: hypothetical protein J6U47_06115, partial [Bacteroidales bacterium]|nr:hypothetical protein [Bacteroidales bacterium]